MIVEDIDSPPPTATEAPRVSVTWFRGAHFKVGTHSPTVAWRSLFDKRLGVARLDINTKKDDIAAWSPALFREDIRENNKVISVAAIVLDYDNQTTVSGKKIDFPVDQRTTQAAALELFHDNLAFTYSSPSHSAALPKFRLVLPTSRLMTLAEHKAIIRHIHQLAIAAGQRPDPKVIDAAHLWFYGVRRNDDYQALWQDGTPLDVNALLATIAARTPLIPPPDETPDEDLNDARTEAELAAISLDNRVGRATRWLISHRPVINTDGSGDLSTVCRTLVRGYLVPPDEALQIIHAHYLTKPEVVQGLAAKLHTDERIARELRVRFTSPAGFKLRKVQSSSDKIAFGESSPDDATLTDMGNAERLAAHVASTVKYVRDWKSFVRWSGAVWERDPNGHYVRADFMALTHIWLRNAMAIEDPERRSQAIRYAQQCQSRDRLNAAVDLLRSFSSLAANASDFDADPWILNTPSGVLQLANHIAGTVTQVAHDPKFMCSKITKVAYNPAATCPTWTAFCESSAAKPDLTPDPDLADYRRRRRGSYLSGNPDKVLEIAFDALGSEDAPEGSQGNSGKTTYYATLAKILGTYADKVHRSVFERSKNEQHPTNLMELEGLRFAYGAEISHSLDLEQVKDLTGERTVKARGMRQDMRSFARHYKLAIFANAPPGVGKAQDDPVWNRVIADGWFLKIEKMLPEAEIDEVYSREAEGIFADIVRGWIDYYSRGLQLAPPEAIRLSTAAYQARENPLTEFLAERCEVDKTYEVEWSSLWEARKEWLKEFQPKNFESAKKFGALLKASGFAAATSGHYKTTIRRGLRLKETVEEINAATVNELLESV